MLTPNHGHAALMGVFGMLGLALMMFAIRQVLTDAQWKTVEKCIRVSFWGLNIGLAMIVLSLALPGRSAAIFGCHPNRYWHARRPAYLTEGMGKLMNGSAAG